MLRMTLGQALRGALERTLPSGWLYLPASADLTPSTPCVLSLYSDSEHERDEDGKPVAAIEAGFPDEGLDTPLMEDTAEAVRHFQDPPSDELLLESFAYYLRFDAFLPRPGAPEPPSAEHIQYELDRQFYELLGPERTDRPCRHEGCPRGAVSLSALCRVHHFESIRGRVSPFVD
jgi:hypothetical protein